ncbi:uncharacterized protein LOC120457655 [Drosophila santomea]|uniref:uncharacterized protein LOC120457655 n=1 Tax=Drosophila santomea TaxID=129105 RepID=UPI0019539D09|nr:uncharacterized protein LOC120457655 [Drosophila santomea]
MELLEYDMMPLDAPGLPALDTGTLEALPQGSRMNAPTCSGRLPLALKRPGGLLLRPFFFVRPFAGPRACWMLRMTPFFFYSIELQLQNSSHGHLQFLLNISHNRKWPSSSHGHMQFLRNIDNNRK